MSLTKYNGGIANIIDNGGLTLPFESIYLWRNKNYKLLLWRNRRNMDKDIFKRYIKIVKYK